MKIGSRLFSCSCFFIDCKEWLLNPSCELPAIEIDEGVMIMMKKPEIQYTL